MLKRNTAAVLAFISVQDFDLAVGRLKAFLDGTEMYCEG
jgi:hypothetical protein